MEILPAEDRAGRLRRFVVSVLVIVALALITGALAVRTAGGRELVRDWLSDAVGEAVEVGTVRVGWPYDLVVEPVKPRAENPDLGPSWRIERMRLGWRFPCRLLLRVRRAAVTLRQDDRGAWEPACLRRMGDLPGRSVAHVSLLTAGMRGRWNLQISDSLVRWVDRQGNQTGMAGVSLHVQPVRVPGRRLYYHRLSVFEMRGADGAAGRELRREWLASDSIDYMELGRDDQALSGTLAAFWDPASRADR
jgi:hypothetical protein